MRTQYRVWSPDPIAAPAIQPVIPQKKLNADALIGFLDLPTGSIPFREFDTYLKVMALFYEHLFIPDGWLHCAGPVTSYLRQLYNEADQNPRASSFAGNTFFQLLRAGIIVPGLRGRRPEKLGDPPLGYDLYQVWSGGVKDSKGSRLPMGVYFDDPSKRLMILDNEDPVNHVLLQQLSEAISRFADWDDPTQPIYAPYDSSAEVARWNNTFRQETLELLFDSPLSVTGNEEIDELVQLGTLTDSQVTLDIKHLWAEFGDQLQMLKSEKHIRRGTYENLVASVLFGDTRLRSYDMLRERLWSQSSWMGNSLFTKASCDVRVLLLLLTLQRVGTIQERSFAEKFKCAAGLCANFSND